METRAQLQASKPEYAVYILRELQTTVEEVQRYHKLTEEDVYEALFAATYPRGELSEKLYEYRQTVVKRTELGITKTRLQRVDSPKMYQAERDYEELVSDSLELKKQIRILAARRGLDADKLILLAKRPRRFISH